jgi:hypothetical protein
MHRVQARGGKRFFGIKRLEKLRFRTILDTTAPTERKSVFRSISSGSSPKTITPYLYYSRIMVFPGRAGNFCWGALPARNYHNIKELAGKTHPTMPPHAIFRWERKFSPALLVARIKKIEIIVPTKPMRIL